jgi:hypothetical protein
MSSDEDWDVLGCRDCGVLLPRTTEYFYKSQLKHVYFGICKNHFKEKYGNRYKCEYCKFSSAGKSKFQRHLKTKKHKKIYQEFSAITGLPDDISKLIYSYIGL